ncbi:MAG: outer membrane beta-barrel protein [Verrucomicrobiota bacterium]
MDQTFIGLSYEYSLKYYEDRSHDGIRGKDYDQTHKFDGRLDHAFSERYKLELSDSFVIAQEPEVIAASGGATPVPLRTEGNNIRNLGSINFGAQLTELFKLELGYANTFYDYQQDAGDVVPGLASRSGLLDRIEHLASVNLRWQIVPETDAILGYQYGIVDFTSDEAIGTDELTGNEISADIRNSRSHYLFGGVDHRFNERFNGSIRVGAQYTDYYNQDNTTVSPYADASLTYKYNQGSYIQAGVTHSRTRTDVATVKSSDDVTADQETTAVYASVNHRITPKLIGSLLLQGQRGTFYGGTADGDVEYFFLGGVNLAYTINPHLLAEVGYNFDYLTSDVEGREYTRNRVYIGIRATY